MAQPQLDDAAVPGQTRNNGSCWPCFYLHSSYLEFGFSKHRTYVRLCCIQLSCEKGSGDHVTKPEHQTHTGWYCSRA